jgi:hypothetical protein
MNSARGWPPDDRQLDLPPPFTERWVAADAFGTARTLAMGDGEPGTLVLGEDDALLELVVILEPDRPAADCFAVLPMAMLAMADALAGLVPDAEPVGFAWPSGLVLDGAAVGRARLALPKPGSEPLPLWLVVGLELRLHSPAQSPDEQPQAALDAAGFADVAAVAIVESFARQFLVRVQDWQTEGLGPAAAAFQERLVGPPGETARIDPQTFDLVRNGTPEVREGLAEGLLLGGAGSGLR